MATDAIARSEYHGTSLPESTTISTFLIPTISTAHISSTSSGYYDSVVQIHSSDANIGSSTASGASYIIRVTISRSSSVITPRKISRTR
jgi:hypothetical protein